MLLHDVLSMLQAFQHSFLVLRSSFLLDLAVAQLHVLTRLRCQMMVIILLVIALSSVIPLSKGLNTLSLCLSPCSTARTVLYGGSGIDVLGGFNVLDFHLLAFSVSIRSWSRAEAAVAFHSAFLSSKGITVSIAHLVIFPFLACVDLSSVLLLIS